MPNCSADLAWKTPHVPEIINVLRPETRGRSQKLRWKGGPLEKYAPTADFFNELNGTTH